MLVGRRSVAGRGSRVNGVRAERGALLGNCAIDRVGQVRGLGVPIAWILGRSARHHGVERLDELGALQARRGRRILDVRPQLCHVVVLRVRDAPREHLVEHAAERVDVSASVHGPTLDLLRRDVVRGPDPGAGPGEAPRRSELLGEPEVGQVDLLAGALSADQDVGRLDVAVHQSALVRRFEGRRHRAHHPLDPVEIELAPVDDLSQVGAWHVTHRQIEDAVVVAAPVDRDDVGMLERRGQPGLRLEAGHGVRVLRVLGRDDLQGHRALEFRVGGLVDQTHPAAVEDALDAVPGEQRARL